MEWNYMGLFVCFLTNIDQQLGLPMLCGMKWHGSFLCFWQGVSPTAQRAATVAGVILPAYDICKFQLRHNLHLEDSMSTHFM